MILDAWNGHKRLGKDNQSQATLQEWPPKLAPENSLFSDDSSEESYKSASWLEARGIITMITMSVCGVWEKERERVDTETNRWCTQVDWTDVYEKITCGPICLLMFLLPLLLVSYTRDPPYIKEMINRVKRQPMT